MRQALAWPGETHFPEPFRDLGYIDHNIDYIGGIEIRSSLLKVVLLDEAG